jgi:transcriptional antiterminator RfaH
MALTIKWHALHGKPIREALLQEQLSRHQVESYYSHIGVKPVSTHACQEKPYFPGYIFGHVDLEKTNLSTFRWMPGAAGIVSFGETPASIPENRIAEMRRRGNEIDVVGGVVRRLEAWRYSHNTGAPFYGYEAVFHARLSGNGRVQVLLKLLNRQQFPLELSSRQINHKRR